MLDAMLNYLKELQHEYLITNDESIKVKITNAEKQISALYESGVIQVNKEESKYVSLY